MKHETVKYRTLDKLGKLVNNKNYKRHEPIFADGEAKFYEITSRKQSITDKVPITTAFYILGNAKLTVQEFIRDIETCLITDALRILYMGKMVLKYNLSLILIEKDTDSIAFALCREFALIVKAGKETDWAECVERWFCKVKTILVFYHSEILFLIFLNFLFL